MPVLLDILFILALYATLSLAAIVMVYRLRRPALLMKKMDGRLPGVSWLIFGIYHLYIRLVFNAWRKASREAPFDEILPNLFLGRRICGDECETVQMLGDFAVLDLTAEFAETEFMRAGRPYLCLPTLDMTAPSEDTINKGMQFIQNELPNRPVFVHCALGHGRSAVMVIAHLLRTGHCQSFAEAYEFVRTIRPGVILNLEQKAVLLRLAGKREPGRPAD